MSGIVEALSRLYGYSPEALTDTVLPPPAATLDMEASTAPLLERYGARDAYSFSCEGHRRTLPVICPPRARGLCVPLPGEAESVAVNSARYVPPRLELPLDRLRQYATKFLAGNGGVWDDDVYRLLSIEVAPQQMGARFGLGRFLDYRLTTGLLREEMAWALQQRDYQWPLREELLPTIDELTAVGARITAGGVQTLCAFAAGDGRYWLPLQRRGNSIAEGAGNWAVVPMGFHQPAASGPLTPAAPSTTALRELYEELFGGPETAPVAAFLDHSAVAWIREHPQAVTLEMTAFNISMLHGNYDFALLLAVHDPWFWTHFSPHLSKSWESESHLILRSDDRASWRNVLLAPNWETQALVTCVEGLRRLGEVVPSAGLSLD